MASGLKADRVLEWNVHEGDGQKESDAERNVILSKMALRVVRFRNEEVVKGTRLLSLR
jgi:very-short-patch-repair endonuclease